MTEKELLRKNVKELQLQLRDAHIRIKELNEKCDELRKRLGLEKVKQVMQYIENMLMI